MPYHASLTKEVMVDDRLVTMQVRFVPLSADSVLMSYPSFGILPDKNVSSLWVLHSTVELTAVFSSTMSTVRSRLKPSTVGGTNSLFRLAHMIQRISHSWYWGTRST